MSQHTGDWENVGAGEEGSRKCGTVSGEVAGGGEITAHDTACKHERDVYTAKKSA